MTAFLVADWISILGNTLNIPPSYVELLLRRHHIKSGSSRSNILDPDYVVVDSSIAVQLPGKHTTPSTDKSTILIIYMGHYEGGNFGLIDRMLRYRDPSVLASELPATIDEMDHQSYHRRYMIVLSRLLDRECETYFETSHLFYTSLLPILQCQGIYLQEMYEKTQVAYSQIKANEGYVEWLNGKCFNLRRAIEGFEDKLSTFHNYIMMRGDEAFLHSTEYLAAQEHRKAVVEMARRLETEIRDYMQVMVSQLSISESWKSIELSNEQIQEGKQVMSLLA